MVGGQITDLQVLQTLIDPVPMSAQRTKRPFRKKVPQVRIPIAHAQTKIEAHPHDMWQAETKADVEAAFDFLIETQVVKCDRVLFKPQNGRYD